MALSVIVYPGDGVRTQFNIPFALGYIKESDVTARVDGEVDGAGNQIYRDLVFLSTEIVEVQGTAVPVGSTIIFERTVDQEDLIVSYEDGDIINEENMNTSQKQMIMLVHQVLDGRFAQFQSSFDMGGFRIVNLGTPVNNTDATTKAYVDGRVNDASTNAAAAALSASQAAAANATAQTAAGTATSASDRAVFNSDNSFKWSSHPEDQQVNDGIRTGYSAYHWAQKAALSSGGGIPSWAGLTGAITKEEAIAVLELEQYAIADLTNVDQGVLRAAVGAGSMAYRDLTVSTAAPTGGVDGDVWYQVSA